MKKYILFAAVGAALLAGACQRDNNGGIEAPKSSTLSFTATNPTPENATRATLERIGDEFVGDWEATDVVGVYALFNGTPVGDGDGNNVSNIPFTYNPAENSFGGSVNQDGVGNWTYRFYYPWVSGGSSLGTTNIPFGNVRTQNGAAYNSAYDILVTPSVAATGAAGGLNSVTRPPLLKIGVRWDWNMALHSTPALLPH